MSALRKIIPDTADAQRNLEAFHNAWRRRYVKELQTLMRRDDPNALYDELYTRRNLAWAPKIAEEAKSGNDVLVLCGCGHLCGKDSLLAVLERDHDLSAVRISA